jgi:hypothetical protein
MDHPRGGKRLHFDEPLTGYPSHRQRRSQPAAAPPQRTLLPSTTPSASSRLPQHTDSSPIVPTQLIEDHRRRQAATARFPPEISNSCVRDCLARYQDHMSAVTAATERVCGSCGCFIEKDVSTIRRRPAAAALPHRCHIPSQAGFLFFGRHRLPLLSRLLQRHQTAEATKVLGPQCRERLLLPGLPCRP